MGAIDEVRNLEAVLVSGLQALKEAIGQLSLPVVTGVSPLVLDIAGGDIVTIIGDHFEEADNVYFGSPGANSPATSFVVVSDTEVTAVNPGSSSAGPGTVSVQTAYGTGNLPAGTQGVVYGTYPLVTGVSPNNGIVGDTVTIAGVGFTGATAIVFSSTSASSYTVVSDTEITVVVPSGANSGDLYVTTPAGTSLARVQDQFTCNT